MLALSELRGVLVCEHVDRVRDGRVWPSPSEPIGAVVRGDKVALAKRPAR